MNRAPPRWNVLHRRGKLAIRNEAIESPALAGLTPAYTRCIRWNATLQPPNTQYVKKRSSNAGSPQVHSRIKVR